jgi:predicted DNA-binding transcriptional regulator AlpA
MSSHPARLLGRAMTKKPIPAPKKFHFDKRADAIATQGKGNDDDLLSTPEVAEWFGVSEPWLENGRAYGYGPPFVRLGPRKIKYRRGNCRDWLLQRLHQSTSEYAR